MIKLEHKTLLDAGVHFGHLTKKWHPKMAPFIFMKQSGIHIIDLNKTISSMEEVALQLHALARAGKKILFVATKKQAKVSVEKAAKDLAMPYVTERWLGGTLTNFVTIRKLLKRMFSIEKNIHTAAYKNLAKKEQLVIMREQAKLNRILQGLSNVTRLPSALFVVDINKEHIAVKEARKLGIPVFALADTNTNPDAVDFP
ncbi:30S ribosomal protein S2, partial [Candidatus Cardinium hertigii]|uniref:30S ribosomal protein S2 n=1 Tax=Candidatus Cardinium hertigii TaxID=247481 RepID=UPI0021A5E4BD